MSEGAATSIKRLLLIAMLMFVIAGCGNKIVPEQILKDTIAANDQIDNFTITMKAVQELQTEDGSMSQKIDLHGQFVLEPLRFYFDMEAKNFGASIKASLYRPSDSSDSLYFNNMKSGDGWMKIDDAQFGKEMDNSLMDYHRPNVYLQMILDDRNHLRAKETEQGILVSLTDPEESTKRKMAQYLLDSIGEDEPFTVTATDLKKLEITVDPATDLIRTMTVEQLVTIKMKEGTTETKVHQTVVTEYGKYNQSSIVLPKELSDSIQAADTRTAS